MRLAWFALVVLPACSLFENQADDTPGVTDAATLVERCQASRDEWRAIVGGLDRTCVTPNDCVAIGGVDTCNCVAHLAANCSGEPVRRAAFEAAAEGIARSRMDWDFHQCRTMIELGAVCDCAPAPATCVNGRCILASPPSCFGVDAGMPPPP